MIKNLSHLLLLLATCVSWNAHAVGQSSLTFVKTDGSTIVFSTDGLCITYDDFAHAVVTNDDTVVAVDLADVDYMCFGEEDVTVHAADVNADGEVNIADVNAVIGVIMSGAPHEASAGRADVNGDGEVNVADINAVITAIFGQ